MTAVAKVVLVCSDVSERVNELGCGFKLSCRSVLLLCRLCVERVV